MIQDNSSKTDSTDFTKYILSYIKAVEESQFKEIMKKNYFIKNMPGCDLKIEYSDLDLMETNDDHMPQNNFFKFDDVRFY